MGQGVPQEVGEGPGLRVHCAPGAGTETRPYGSAVAWVCRRRGGALSPPASRAGASLAVAVGLSAAAFLASIAWADDEPDRVELRVLTFNVWHGLRPDGGKLRLEGEDPARKEERFDWQIEQLRELDADVLLLQEVNPNQRQSRRYAAALGMDEIHKVASCGVHLGPIKIPANVNEGLAILARPELRLRRVGTKRLSGNARCAAGWGFQTKESRYVLFGEVDLAGARVLVANTHLSAPPHVLPGFETRLREMVLEGSLEAQQRRTIVDTLERKRARNLAEVDRLLVEIEWRTSQYAGVILGGDFNASPGSASIRSVEAAGLRAAASGPGFETWDPIRNAENKAIGERLASQLPTYGKPELDDWLRRRDEVARQIDYVFVSQEWRVGDAALVLEGGKEGLLASDHFGVLVMLAQP